MDVAYFCTLLFLLSSSALTTTTYAKLGINWGRAGTGSLVPSMVVDLFLQNGIKEVKLYNIDDDIIKAFGRTNIGVSIVLHKPENVTSLDLAMQFVKEKIEAFPQVNIKYVVLGSNPFSAARVNKLPYSSVVESLRFVQKAIDLRGYGGKVKAILTHTIAGVLTPNSTRKPSEASFRPDLMDSMLEVLSLFNQTNAPFMFDSWPIGYINVHNLDLDFAFVDNNCTYRVTDVNGLTYTNYFDVVYDCFVWALKKAGFENMKVVCSQIGWATDGWPGANVAAAERFWKGLLPLATNNRGTPMRPGEPIDIYLHSLADENKNSVLVPVSRHWGIYWSNGEPKYKIDLSGQGRDIYPTKVMGINLMPPRWCVFNGNNKDMVKVKEQSNSACDHADCTSLAPGGSCGMLDDNQAVSYAFNAYFQAKFQDKKACDFDGFGELSLKNPSTGTCVFIVEVVKGSKQTTPFTRWG